MLSTWITALVTDHAGDIAKFAAEQVKDPVMKAVGLDPLSKALRRANETFLSLFETEFKRREPFANLLSGPAQQSLSAFLSHAAVQERLAEPFRNSGTFDTTKLSGLWQEIRQDSGTPLIDLPSEFSWRTIGEGYVEAVRQIRRESAELRPLLEADNLEAIKRLEQQQVGVAPRFDLDRYREALIDRFEKLKLSAMRADSDSSARDHTVRLQRVYVPQQVKEAFPPRALSRDYRKKLEAESRLHGVGDERWQETVMQEYERAPVRALPEILTDPSYQRLVVMGDPGLGKSTLLQHLALDWAERHSASIPFLIELGKYTRDHSRPKSFLEYLEKGSWSNCHVLQGELDRLLREDQTVVLFDGLDEVFDTTLRGNIVAEIINFARDYPRAWVIVTTRVVGYAVGSPNPELFQQAGFRQFTLQDFQEPEIEKFIGQWYAEAVRTTPAEREELTVRLSEAIKGWRAVREILYCLR